MLSVIIGTKFMFNCSDESCPIRYFVAQFISPIPVFSIAIQMNGSSYEPHVLLNVEQLEIFHAIISPDVRIQTIKSRERDFGHRGTLTRVLLLRSQSTAVVRLPAAVKLLLRCTLY